MKKNIYRSENLLVTYIEADQALQFEIRFSTSYTRGRCDARCPRCKNPVSPARWEVEGPDGTSNTVWFECRETLNGKEPCGRDLHWVRQIAFADWVETEK